VKARCPMPDARRPPIATLPAVEAVPTIDATAVVEPLLRGCVAWAAAQLPQYGVAADAPLAGELAGTPRLQGWRIGARQTRRS
jgi:hypothetical protein